MDESKIDSLSELFSENREDFLELVLEEAFSWTTVGIKSAVVCLVGVGVFFMLSFVGLFGVVGVDLSIKRNYP